MPVDSDDVMAAWKIPAMVIGVGMVSSVTRQESSFTVAVAQYIAGGQNETVMIRGIMEKSPKWPDPVARLPALHGVVAFTAKLSHFENDKDGINATAVDRAVIVLDSITYLPRSASPPSLTNTGPSFTSEDSDDAKVKQHVQKISLKENSTTSASIPITPQSKQRAKRKASAMESTSASSNADDARKLRKDDAV